MCFPAAIPLVGAALSAGGAYMGQQNQNKMAKAGVRAREDATRDEIARQHQFEAEGVQQRDRAVNAVTAPAMPLAALQQRRAAAMKAAAAPGAEYSPAPASAPRIVQGEVARKGKLATAKAGAQAAAQGKLGAYNDLTFNQGLDLAGAGRKLATTAGASQGSASLLPADVAQETANATRGANDFTFADVLGLTGQGLQLAGGLGATDGFFAPAMPPKSPGMSRLTGRI